MEIKDNAVVEQLPLDIDPDSEEVLLTVAPALCKKLKPHQARGIKFMFEAVFESKSQLEKGKKPGGAILAHCMGLGKTLQNITLIHTIMTNFPEVSLFIKSKGYGGILERHLNISRNL